MKPAATWELIDSVTPWPGNPRINDAAIGSVRDSIERFGFVCIAAEMEPAYCDIIRARLTHAVEGG